MTDKKSYKEEGGEAYRIKRTESGGVSYKEEREWRCIV